MALLDTDRLPGNLLTVAALLNGLVVAALVLPGSVLRYPQAIPYYAPLATIYSSTLGHAYIALTLAGLGALFVAGVVMTRGLEGREATLVVFGCAVLMAALFVFVYPGGSRDIFHNMADARTLWVYGENPTEVAPSAHLDAISASVTKWRDSPSAYGPVYYLLTAPPALLAGDSVLANLLAFKAYNALFLLAAMATVWLAAGRMDPRYRLQAAVLVGWNPYLHFEAIGNGHNDMIMMLFAAAALLLAAHSGLIRALLLLGVSVLVKYATIALAPLVLLLLWRTGHRRDRALMVGLLAAGVAGAAAYLLAAADGLQSVRSLAVHEAPFLSLRWLLTYLTRVLPGDEPLSIYRALALGLTAVAYTFTVLRFAQARTTLWQAAFWAMAVAVFTKPLFFPWYLVWFVPLAAAQPRSREAELACAFSVAGLLYYAAYSWWYLRETPMLLLTLAFFSVPILVLAGHAALARRGARRRSPVEAPLVTAASDAMGNAGG